jgi:hypothetical protein
VNTPSAKAEGFSPSGPSALSHTQCVARAFRGWIPRLSIPRAVGGLTICLEELVSASFVNCMRDFNKKIFKKKAACIPALKEWVLRRQG